MGAEQFEELAVGKDVDEAFRRITDEARYEHGHGGYTGSIGEKGDYVVIQKEPVSEAEARGIAYVLMDESDPRIDDKWGPAGAIPVVLDTRKVEVGPFDYTEEEPSRVAGDAEAIRKAREASNLWQAVTPLVKLKKGETIESVGVTRYEQPTSRPHYGGGMGGYVTNRRRTNAHAVVTINKPARSRKVVFTTTIPNFKETNEFTNHSFQDFVKIREALKEAAASNVRLKPGERIVSVDPESVKNGKAKVVAEAPKLKTVTRYIVKGSRSHESWKTGFETQAAARSWATEAAKTSDVEVEFEIEGVTRREDGSPLVSVTREVSTLDYEVCVIVTQALDVTEPEAWLFFGWASS